VSEPTPNLRERILRIGFSPEGPRVVVSVREGARVKVGFSPEGQRTAVPTREGAGLAFSFSVARRSLAPLAATARAAAEDDLELELLLRIQTEREP
jgi:hypothetical protein